MNIVEFLVTMYFIIRATKFFGEADLGSIHKQDGKIYGFAESPFSVIGENSKVSHYIVHMLC